MSLPSFKTSSLKTFTHFTHIAAHTIAGYPKILYWSFIRVHIKKEKRYYFSLKALPSFEDVRRKINSFECRAICGFHWEDDRDEWALKREMIQLTTHKKYILRHFENIKAKNITLFTCPSSTWETRPKNTIDSSRIRKEAIELLFQRIKSSGSR